MDIVKQIVDQVVEQADNIQAEQITVFHVSEQNWITDYVVILGVKTSIHAKAVEESLLKYLSKIVTEHSKEFYDPIRISGTPESGWTILDVNSIVIHCINEEKREFYDLDSIFEKQGPVFHY